MNAQVVQAFTEEQTARLTGASRRQLQSWDDSGFYHPSIAAGQRRVYSFRDLLNLRVIVTLRRDLGISLQHLRDVGRKLREIADADWAGVILYVLNRRVVFDNPLTRQREEVVDGQGVFVNLPLRAVRSDMEAAVHREFARDPERRGQIEKVRRVVGSEPVIAGTRVMVRSVLAFIEEGYDDDAIIAEYPSLTPEDIAAVRAGQSAA